MASDPTIPDRLAALGFQGPACWACNGCGDHGGILSAFGPCIDCHGQGFNIRANNCHDAAIRFLAHRLAGKRVPLPADQHPRPMERADAPTAAMLLRAANAETVDEVAGRLRRAALHLVGLKQAVAWAEGVE